MRTGAVIGAAVFLLALSAAIYWGFQIGSPDIDCSSAAGVSCDSSTTQAKAPVTVTGSRITPSPTKARPTTTQPSTTSARPAVPAPPSIQASTSTSATTSRVPSPPPLPTLPSTTSKPPAPTTPAQPALVKQGTLDTFQPAAACPSGGIQVSLNQSPPPRSNGLTFRLVSSGTNNSPELQISGVSDYTFAEIRVVTDAGNPFVGHTQSRSTTIPKGTGNISYDVLASNLVGAVVCM